MTTQLQERPMSNSLDATDPSRGIAYLLWLLCFTGFFGVHRFYTGRWVTGLIWIFTGGLLLVGQIVDLFLIPGQCRRPKW